METYINIDDLGGIPITLDTFINNIYIYTHIFNNNNTTTIKNNKTI